MSVESSESVIERGQPVINGIKVKASRINFMPVVFIGLFIFDLVCTPESVFILKHFLTAKLREFL